MDRFGYDGEADEEVRHKLGIGRTSLAVQWFKLCTSTARGMGLIPGWGTKIPHAAQ